MLIAIFVTLLYFLLVFLSKVNTARNYPVGTPKYGRIPNATIDWPSTYSEQWQRIWETEPRAEVTDGYITTGIAGLVAGVLFITADLMTYLRREGAVPHRQPVPRRE